MLVSTIIPVYNRQDMVRSAVESVLTQTYRPIEVILVDDGSTDGTAAVLADLQADHPSVIRVIRQENGGPGVAREAGRVSARGDFIQYLDSDDRLLPGKFEAQVEALRGNPDCCIAYGKTRLVDEHGAILRAPYKLSGEKHEYLFPMLLVDRWWNTHTPLYRRRLCDRVGSWPSNRMCEDWQYDASCGALKAKLAFVDSFVSEHVQHSNERLTSGPLSGLKLRDVGQLIPVLYESAVQGGVKRNCVQMGHFSRWAFSMARRLAMDGQQDLAACCYHVWRCVCQHQSPNVADTGFHALCGMVGLRAASHVCEVMFRLLRRKPGQATLPQAWE